MGVGEGGSGAGQGIRERERFGGDLRGFGVVRGSLTWESMRLRTGVRAVAFVLAVVSSAGAAPRVPPAPAPAPVRVAPTRRAPPAAPVRATATPPAEVHASSAAAPLPAPPRDWARAPAVAVHEPRGAVFAVSDLHGRYQETFALLSGNGLVHGDPKDPRALTWTGKTATLVVVGDLVNKGPEGLAVVDMLRALQASAEKAGGKVIVTLGNHEAEFLHDPISKRALRDGTDGRTGFGHELAKAGLDPRMVAAGLDPEGRGAWLRSLPFAAKVGDSFFVHSGNTAGRSIPELAASVQHAVETEGFGHEYLVGLEAHGPLGEGDWKLTASEARINAARLGVKRIVMGHIVSALGADGEIAKSTNGALVKLDTGLGNAEGPPRMAKFGADGKMLQLGPTGEARGIHKRRI